MIWSTAGPSSTSSVSGAPSPRSLFGTPTGDGRRSTMPPSPSARSSASAARTVLAPQVLETASKSGVDVSAHLFRDVCRQQCADGMIDQGIREIFHLHALDGAGAHVEGRRGLRVAHELGTRELHRFGQYRRTGGVR